MSLKPSRRQRTTQNKTITVAICTFRRINLLEHCLRGLERQTFKDFDVVVVDNDSAKSAAGLVESAAHSFHQMGIALFYACEPRQGIAQARNLAVSLARGTYVAFIDDDEVPSRDWLDSLLRTCRVTGADGVAGVVLPNFPEGFPDWQRQGFFERPRAISGTRIPGKRCCTANMLVRRELLTLRDGPFRDKYGRTGGEDADLFDWLHLRGYRFVWCDEASVEEYVPLERSRVSWHLRRAYRSGWGYSSMLLENHGLAAMTSHLLLGAELGYLKSLVRACAATPSARATGLLLLRGSLLYFGKWGFVLGKSVEEYRGKS